MKLIGLGSNLSSPAFGPPAAVVRAALARLDSAGLHVASTSRLYETAPIPASDQPWYVNAVAAVETGLTAREALAACMAIEAEFGRVRGVPNAARVLDLDVLAWDDQVIAEPDLLVPHPRLAERAFVLFPLADVAPAWRHPISRETVSKMIAKLPSNQQIRPLEAGERS
jgi:2-amino-4-hydroxy-6-hydroxymethyldihydropteridine diphosphokinase